MKLSGVVSFSEMLDVINAAADHPDYVPGFNVLSDHRDLENPIRTEEVVALSRHFKIIRDKYAGARWAVVTSRQASFGMMRMLSVYLDEIPIKLNVFYSFAEAENWLTVSEETT